MNNQYVTTPFGRRSMTLAMLTDHIVSNDRPVDKSVDKWKLYRDLCQAKPLLDLSDRALALLNALLSFYPKAELSSAHDLIVFPSNNALSLRTHGMAEQTIRRHLASLVEAGLLLRKDSPNGKRYARRGREGEVRQAFGFSLAPLLARAEEFAALAEKVEARRQALHALREDITLHRRDIVKLLGVAVGERVPGDWSTLRDAYDTLLSAFPRNCSADRMALHLEDLAKIHAEIVNTLKDFANSQNTSGKTCQNERHIESKPESRFNSNSLDSAAREPSTSTERAIGNQRFHIGLIARACPNVATLHPKGTISTEADLLTLSPLLTSMLSINVQVLDLAFERMGRLATVVALACLYERGDEIDCASAYLRNLSSLAKAGKFSAEAMLRSLLNRNQPIEEETLASASPFVSEPPAATAKLLGSTRRPSGFGLLTARKQLDPRLSLRSNPSSIATQQNAVEQIATEAPQGETRHIAGWIATRQNRAGQGHPSSVSKAEAAVQRHE